MRIIVATVLVVAVTLHILIWAGFLWMIHISNDAEVLVGYDLDQNYCQFETFTFFNYTDYNCLCKVTQHNFNPFNTPIRWNT